MKKFNKSIEIIVELDQIATMLLETINVDFKHREMLVESIVGRLDAKNDKQGMTMLYNSLNGYDNTINFEKDDVVHCTKKEWGYWTPDSITRESTVQAEIGECRVVEVNPFADNTLTVEYMKPLKEGGFKPERISVHHSMCSRTAIEEFLTNNEL